MPKEFYTERDIEELFKQGVRSLRVSDEVALTELAYEKAKRLGINLDQIDSATPPSAPMRPHLSQPSGRPAATPASLSSGSAAPGNLQARIRNAVTARLGNQINAKLLDTIIQRVLAGTGLK